MRWNNNPLTGFQFMRHFIYNNFRLAFYDLGKRIKGEVFSVSPSPVSNDMTLIFPVDFFRIVLVTTELGTYSMSSTTMCAFDFSSSFGILPAPTVGGPVVLSFFMLQN